jgi:DNA mismatch repair ATPase MutS
MNSHLLSLYEPPFEPVGLRGQYRWFIEKYPEICIFFQVGKFCELYGEQAERFSSFFGLKFIRETREMGKQCGFPVRMLRGLKREALLAGLPYVVVGETGYYSSGLKKRVVTEMLTFDKGES